MTAEYPSAETTLLGLHTAVNNIKIAITSAIDDAVTTIPTSDTTNIPSKGYLTFMDGSDEIIYYAGKTLNSLTSVTRGADGSNNTAHADAAEIEMRWNADYHNRQSEEIKAISDDLRGAQTGDLDDGVTPATTAASLLIRLNHIATQLKLLSGKADWKTAPATTLQAEYTDTNNIKTVDLDESATPATTATSIKDRLDQISAILIGLSGKADWKTAPADTLQGLSDELVAIQTDLNDAVTPVASAADLNVRLNHIATQLKLITGEADWKTAPSSDIASLITAAGDRSNIIVNGGMEVWQRGNSFASPADSTISADRWQLSRTGSPTFNITRESTIVDSGSYSMKIAVTVASGSSRLDVRQIIEDYVGLRGRTITASVKYRCNTASAMKIRLTDSFTTDTTDYHPGDSSWQTANLSITVNAAATGVTLRAGMVDAGDQKVAEMFIDSVSLVIGSTAFPYEPEDPQVELARCQRHYEKGGEVRFIGWGGSEGTNYMLSIPVDFNTEKVSSPTVTVSVTRVQDDGGGADTKASYTQTSQGISTHGFSCWIYKAIAGSRPAELRFTWTAEV